jgi:hypothetical protein
MDGPLGLNHHPSGAKPTAPKPELFMIFLAKKERML